MEARVSSIILLRILTKTYVSSLEALVHGSGAFPPPIRTSNLHVLEDCCFMAKA